MLVSPAYAQAAAGAPSGMGALAQFVPLILIFAIMYFLMIRPQQKKMAQHREMVASLKKGDSVVTQGGLIGRVTAVRDDELEVEIAPGVKVRAVRGTIAGLAQKSGTTPAANG